MEVLRCLQVQSQTATHESSALTREAQRGGGVGRGWEKQYQLPNVGVASEGLMKKTGGRKKGRCDSSDKGRLNFSDNAAPGETVWGGGAYGETYVLRAWPPSSLSAVLAAQGDCGCNI